MKQYLNLLKKILNHGSNYCDRTGVGVRSIFGYQMHFNLSDGFPLLTTKKVNIRSIIYELLWFLQGNTNIKWLKDHGISIWNPWANPNGELGPIYGYQWRSWPSENGSIDQISNLIENIQKDPRSRRLIVSSWNVSDLQKMKLPPCHCFFQMYVSKKQELSCQLYQRSADIFLGVPFNVASYALLTMMIAQICNLKAYKFIHVFGDVHLYSNHYQQAKEQLTRIPKRLPFMKINKKVKNIFSFKFEDFSLENYEPEPYIKAPIAI